MEREEMIETLKALRESCEALDKDCVDDPEDILGDINCNAHDSVEALSYCICVLEGME